MKYKLLLVAIFLISVFLRTYEVGSYPPLLWDEAALGYNSYSILKTGKDEYGAILPLIFKSFGDYKPGLYIYASLPFIATLGLTEIGIRSVSIICGILICIFLYKLTNSKSVFLLSAITPFLVHYSRGAWETNMATFFLLLSVFFYIKKKPFLAILLLGINLYVYQSGKFLSLSFFVFYLVNQPKEYLKKIPILIVIAIPLLIGLFSGNDGNRLQVVSLLSYPRTEKEVVEIKQEVGELRYNLFFSQPFFFLKNFATRYLNHFSPQFLFTQGDWQNPRHGAPYTGVLLYTCIILLPIGLFNFKKSPINNLMLFWLIVAPVAASLTRDQIQATRSMSMAIPLVYFSGFGLQFLFQKQKYLGLIVAIFSFLSLTYYSDLYFNHMINKSPKDWLYGYKESINFIQKKSYDNIYMTDFYGQPYIYYLFYSKYDPVRYQQKNSYQETGVDTGRVTNIDNIKFDSPSFSDLSKKNNSLVIFSDDEILRQNLDKKLFTPIGKIGNLYTFYAYETK